MCVCDLDGIEVLGADVRLLHGVNDARERVVRGGRALPQPRPHGLERAVLVARVILLNTTRLQRSRGLQRQGDWCGV